MNKIFRLAKIIVKTVAKPAQSAFYRIPQIQHVVGDNTDNFQIQPMRFQNYLYKLQELQVKSSKEKLHIGLSELVKINAQLLIQHNFVRFVGDYTVCANPDEFIHALQLYRMGALAHFFSIDDLETTISSFIPENEIEFQDSQVF